MVSATVGLYGIHEVWTGSYVLTAAVSEVVAVLGGALVLLLEWRRASGGQTEHRLSVRRAHLR